MIRITAFKKRYYQFFFKIKVVYLIVILILSEKRDLMKLSSHIR